MAYDTILVHNLEISGRHGVFAEERAEGRRFVFCAEVDVVAGEIGRDDTLQNTIDYRTIAAVIVEVVQGPSVHLIETLGDEICARLMSRLPIEAVRLEIKKFATGVPGDPEWVGLRVERKAS